jgi:predicted kinase
VTGPIETAPPVVARLPRLYVLVGLPGSGKTTYARRRLPNAIRISLDDLRLMMSGRTYDERYEPAVAAAGNAALKAVLANAAAWGMDVVFDATNVSRAWRARSLEAAAGQSVVPVAVFFPCPLEVALRRNRRRRYPVPDDVIRRFHDNLEEPSREEGFAEVLVVDEMV